MEKQTYSKFKKPVLIFLGSIIFILSTILTYASIDSSIKFYNQTSEVVVVKATSTPDDINDQYVIISFDGSRSLSMWENTRQFARDMRAKGVPVSFTYFINPIYLVTREKAKEVYQPPRGDKGASLIGYGKSGEEIGMRVREINGAYSEGHEIGSHAVGHFAGGSWSKQEWLQELNSFNSLIVDVQKNNPDTKIDPWVFDISKIIGFRAPELSVNSSMGEALAEKGYLYDASGIRMGDKKPFKDINNMWKIGLGVIGMKKTESNRKTEVLSMDYNFWMSQSRIKDVAHKGTPLWDSYFAEVRGAYMDYFNKNYNGNHAPVVIGDHFSLWNDGVYWEALKSFAQDVCGKPHVKCVSFREYLDHLNNGSN